MIAQSAAGKIQVNDQCIGISIKIRRQALLFIHGCTVVLRLLEHALWNIYCFQYFLNYYFDLCCNYVFIVYSFTEFYSACITLRIVCFQVSIFLYVRICLCAFISKLVFALFQHLLINKSPPPLSSLLFWRFLLSTCSHPSLRIFEFIGDEFILCGYSFKIFCFPRDLYNIYTYIYCLCH